ncbi:MAG: hypothetical protein HN576_09410 [Bacteriovoracaceae bacterium]|jgi:hypothetical protein|nr:hypothetical protein [Bacteriovoracaceae bacterium]
MNKLYITLYLLIVFNFASCMYDNDKSVAIITDYRNADIPNQNIQKLPAGAKHNFNNLYKYILKPKCVSCHSGNEPDDDIDLTSYDNILNHPYYYLVVAGSPLESSLYLSVSSDDMPFEGTPLTDQEKKFIKKWIELNAPQK